MNTWHDRDRLDLNTEFLDRQVLDPDGNAVGKADDLRLRSRADGTLEVSDVVVGTSALLDRTSGWAHRLLRWTLRLCGGADEPRLIPLDQVTGLSSAVTVSAAAAEHAASSSEERVRRMIRRVPGADGPSR